jgi:hypothetical protein
MLRRSIKEVLGYPLTRRFRKSLGISGGMQSPVGPIEVSTTELEALLEQARHEPLRNDGSQKLKAAIGTLGLVTELLEKQETTLAELRELLCPASSEKKAKVLERAGPDSEKKPKPGKKPAAGHGRNGADAYGGAAGSRFRTSF